MSEQAYMNASSQQVQMSIQRLTEYRDEPPIDFPEYFLLESSPLVQVVASRQVKFLWRVDSRIIIVMTVFDM